MALDAALPCLSQAVISSLVAVSVVAILWTFRRLWQVRKRLPPGPQPLPFLGNILDFTSGNSHEVFSKWSEKYGGLVTVWFGSRPSVVANDTQSIRELLITQGQSCSSRPSTFLGNLYSPRRQGVVLAPYGPDWKFCRRLAHHAVKTYSEHRTKLEHLLTTECEELVVRLKDRTRSEPIMNPKEDLSLTVMNIILSLLFNTSYQKNDTEFQTIYQRTIRFSESFGKLRLLNIAPMFRLLKAKEVKAFKREVDERDKFIHDQISSHKKTFDTAVMRDFTDALLDISSDPTTSEDGATPWSAKLLNEQIVMILADLSFAGFETTLNSILWGVLYLAVWPETQEKAFSELCQFHKVHDGLSYSHRSSVPYLQALLHEILRLSSVAALGVGHETTDDVVISGNTIPKGTLLLTNFHAIHHNPNVWEKPQDFQPERFLTNDGQFRIPNDSFYPFGAGLRSCIGETVAKTEMFFILAYLIRHFKISTCDGNIPRLDGVQHAVLEARPFTVRFETRD